MMIFFTKLWKELRRPDDAKLKAITNMLPP